MSNIVQPKRIGLLFGSFNPVHNGHIDLAREALKTGHVDELWFVVSPHNPHKHQSELASFEHRIAMVRLATKDDNGIIVSDFEKNLPVPSYTYMTLRKLRAEYPETTFTLVVGDDVIDHIHTWKETKEITTYHDFLARVRDDSPMNIPDGVRVTIVPGMRKASATEVRNALREGKEIMGVSPEVVQYIKKYCLYEKDN